MFEGLLPMAGAIAAVATTSARPQKAPSPHLGIFSDCAIACCRGATSVDPRPRAIYGNSWAGSYRFETYHGCCMEPVISMSPGLVFREPVLRFLKIRRLTAAGECLCGRHDACCQCFRASVGPKVQKTRQKHSQIARPLGHNACEKSLFQSHRS